MKKISLLLFTGCFYSLSIAQSPSASKTSEQGNEGYTRCAQVEYENYLRSVNPKFDQMKSATEKVIYEGAQKYAQEMSSGKAMSTVYTIPTVVHVVYNGSGNVTDAQVTAAINNLNKDWSRRNADTTNTPTVWQPRAASLGVQFCLAQIDPNGLPTTGIIHKSTTVTSFTSDDKVKSTSTGGDDSWPITQYYNIWICNLGGGLLGYGSFPPPGTGYGTVVHYCTIDGSCPPYNLARTLSHECGHCFGLFHIWGDDGTACTGSDQIADTPNMAGNTSGCPSGVQLDACAQGMDSPASNEGSNIAPGRMYQNFMDYTDDACYNMFTVGQKAVVQSTVTNYLMSLVNNGPIVCSPPVPLDAGISSVITPSGNYCTSAALSPIVVVKNYGTTTLTSCTINFYVDANPASNFSWTGSLTIGQTATVTLPSTSATAGTHTFTAATSSPNGGTDGNTANDQQLSTFNLGTTGAALPVVEGFQNTFPPSGWTLYNPSADADNWKQNTTYGSGSTKSAEFNNCNPADTNHGVIHQMRTISYNFIGAPANTKMTFDVGYAPYYSTTYCDTLAILYSTNCGTSWTKIYQKGGVTLATVPCVMSNSVTCGPYSSAGCFAPTSAAAWRNDSIQLGALVGQGSVMFAFENIGEFGSGIFLDNINIGAVATSVNKISLGDQISLYPNPASGTFYVALTNANSGVATVTVCNILGETVSSQTDPSSTTSKNFTFNVSDWTNGVYLVVVQTAGGKAVKRLILNNSPYAK